MKHFSSLFIVLTLLLSGTGTALAGGSKVAEYMGNLRWGMTESDVLNHLEREVQKNFKGAEARRLLSALEDGVVDFDSGAGRRWDESAIAGEFTRGNGETMIYFDAGSSQSYYFFIEGRLWKWVKTINADQLGGRNFQKFGKTISKRFGKGHKSSGERNDASGKQQWYEYRDRETRLRAVDITERYGQFALVFAELDTTRRLASLRTHTQGRAKRDDQVARRMSPATGVSGNRRSIFGGEPKEESDADYQKRVKREREASLAKQRRAHERKQQKKGGKVLKGVGTESDDPLAGI